MLLTDEQRDLRARARDLAQRVFAPRAAYWDEREEYPHENVEELVEAGFHGMAVPKEYGGQGRSMHDVLVVVEEVAKACGVTARIVVDSNLGPVTALSLYGTEEQKRMYFPRVLSGDKPCIAISEPQSGTDAGAMWTTARMEGDEWVINGRKHWITGAQDSYTHLVFARIGSGEYKGRIGGFLIPAGASGLRCGRRNYAMGLRGIPEMEVILEDCHVPRSMLLTVGMKNLMTAYNAQRIGAGTVALGIAQGAFDLAVRHGVTRRQFDRLLCEFQGLQWKMADSRMQLDAARLLLHRAAVDTDPATGTPRPDLTAMAKVYAAETAIRVTIDAQQMFGASGYGRELPLERMVRDARMFTIGGGTVEIQRTLIASHIFGRKFPQRLPELPAEDPRAEDAGVLAGDGV